MQPTGRIAIQAVADEVEDMPVELYEEYGRGGVGMAKEYALGILNKHQSND